MAEKRKVYTESGRKRKINKATKMPKGVRCETPQDRLERFNKAKARKMLWETTLGEAYAFSIPNANDFLIDDRSPGQERALAVWDPTAIQSVQQFASNLQTAIMPNMQRWAKLVPMSVDDEPIPDEIYEQFEGITERLFEYINGSNFYLAIYQSAQDLAIGTGVLMINEEPEGNPFNFTAVKMAHVYFEAGKRDQLDTFWREIKSVAHHRLPELWDSTNFTESIWRKIELDPYGESDLIEGQIFYPHNPPGYQYLYYVTEEGVTEDIVCEWRDYPNFIGFRYSVASGEVVGRGPVLTVLSNIRMVNALTASLWAGAQMRINPPWGSFTSSAYNADNINIVPGTIIPLDPAVGVDGLKPLELTGDLSQAQQLIESYQAAIKAITFASPLSDEPLPNVTATQTTIMQQEVEALRGPAFARFQTEAELPILDVCLFILKRQGKIKIPPGYQFKLEFKTPLADVQNQMDIESFTGWYQEITSVLGPAAVAAIDLPIFVEWLAKKFNVDPEVVNSQFKNSPIVQNVMQTINQGPQQAQSQPIDPQSLVPNAQEAQEDPQGIMNLVQGLNPTPQQEAGGSP